MLLSSQDFGAPVPVDHGGRPLSPNDLLKGHDGFTFLLHSLTVFVGELTELQRHNDVVLLLCKLVVVN